MIMVARPRSTGSVAPAGPATRRTAGGIADLLLRVATAATLALQAYVHLHDRGFYTAARGGAVSQSTLFLLDAIATSGAAAVLILGFRVRIGRRADWIVAFALASSALGAVLLYRYVDVGTIGPLPNMYEPTWEVPGKLLSAYAEGAAVVLSALGFASGHPRSALATSGWAKQGGNGGAPAGTGTLMQRVDASAARLSAVSTTAVLLLVTACSGSGAPNAVDRPPSPSAISSDARTEAPATNRPAHHNAAATAPSRTGTRPPRAASAKPNPGTSPQPAAARSLSPAPSPAPSRSTRPTQSATSSPARTPTPTPSSTVAAASLSIVDYAFDPKTMSVPVGTTVRATNHGQVTHTWTSKTGTWDSKNLNPGQSFSYRFTTAGVFSFVCSIHASMTGTVTVQ